VFVALVIHRVMRMRHIATCGLAGFTLPHYVINGTIFEKEKATEHKMCVLIFPTTFV
jgi:hypothetical protein